MTKLEELKAAASAATAAVYDACRAREDADAAVDVAWDAEREAWAAYKAELKKQENSDD